MRGNDVIQQVMAQRTGVHRFIKWWRKDSDFVDFELIDIFLGHVKADDTIDGFELLDMEKMWDVLLSLNPGTLSRGRRNGERKGSDEKGRRKKREGNDRHSPLAGILSQAWVTERCTRPCRGR